MAETKPKPEPVVNQEVKKSRNPFNGIHLSPKLKKALIFLTVVVLLSTVYTYASYQKSPEYKKQQTDQNKTTDSKDTGPDSSGISQQQQRQQDYYRGYTDPSLLILKDQYEYYSSQLIPFTSIEEPAIYLSNENFQNKINVKLYRASESDVLNSLVYDSKENKTKNAFNESKLQLVKELEVTPESKKATTKVLLPLDESGVYYVRASAPESSNKTADGAFLVRSTFAVVSKEGNNEIIYWGTNLKQNESIDDGEVNVYNLADKVTQVSNASFNEEGIAKTSLSSRNDVAVIKRGNEVSIIPLNLQHIDSGYDYDSYVEKSIATKYFTFTDRPLYKPGDTINFKSIIRNDDDARYSVPEGTAKVEIWKGWEENDLVYSAQKSISPEGTVFGSYKLPEDASAGSYRISIEYPIKDHSDDQYYYTESEYFEVQYFRKPDYNIDLVVDDKDYISGDRLNFKILGNYFSGQPITEGTVSYKIYSSDYYDYRYFNEFAKEQLSDSYRYGYWYGDPFKSGELKFNNNGEAVFDEVIKLEDKYKTNQVIVVEAEYDNGSGNPSFARKNILFYKGQSNVYLQDNAPYNGVINKELKIPMEVVPYLNSSVSNIDVEVTGKWKKYETVYKDDQKYPEYKEVFGEVGSKKLKTDSSGKLTYAFTPTTTGSYDFDVKYTDRAGNKVSRTFSFYVSDKEYEYYDGNPYDDTGITVKVDKKLYNPEDTAKVSISSDNKTKRDVLITLERGRVQRYLTTRIENGVGSVDIPLKDTDSPNVYVVASTFDGDSLQTSSENIPISTDNKKIDVQITPRGDTRYGPGEDLTLDIYTSDHLKQPVSTDMAVWAVDKAIFELIDQSSYDILNNFWRERYNDTTTTHSLQGINSSSAEGGGCFLGETNVLTKNGLVHIKDIKIGDVVLTKRNELDSDLVEAKVTRIHRADVGGYLIINQNLKVTPNHIMWVNNSWQEAGNIQKGDLLLDDSGKHVKVESVEVLNRSAEVYNLEVEKYHTYFAGGYWVHNQKGDARTTFKDTAYWNPSVTTGDDGKATITFKLPDNLTTWVIAGIAANRSTQVGVTKEEVIVGKDVIVRPILPNILRENDKAVFSALVQNFTENGEEFNVSLKFDSGTVEPAGDKVVRIDSNKSETVYWTVTPTKVNEKAKFTYSAVSKSSDKNSDIVVQSIPVKQFGFYEERGESKNNNSEYSIKLSPDSINSLSKIKLNLSADVLGSLRSSLDYLIDYPYGCMEQTTSRFVPAIVAQENPIVFSSALLDKDMDEILNDGIKRIQDHQNGDGGWTWYHSGASSPYLTSYVVEYLVKAQKMGYQVDPNMISRVSDYLRNVGTNDKSDKVYALYGLELLNANDTNVTDFEGLSVEANALAVIINSKNGLTDPNLSGLNKLVSQAKRQSGIAYWESKNNNAYGSNASATALAIRAILASKSEPGLLNDAVNYLTQPKPNYYWYNTHGTAQVIAAISEYSKVKRATETNYAYSVSLDDKALSSGRFTNITQAPRELRISAESIKPEGSSLKTTKDGIGELITSVSVSEFHTDPNTKALSKGLEVKRAYVSEKGKGKSIAVGDLVDVYIQVKNTFEKDSTYGVIQDELPAGLVPVNTAFNNEQFDDNNNDYYYYTDDEYTQNGIISYIYGYYGGYSYLHYKARAITEGTFETPPATASLMYSPEIYGRSDAEKVVITNESVNFDESDAYALANQDMVKEYDVFSKNYGYGDYARTGSQNLDEIGDVDSTKDLAKALSNQYLVIDAIVLGATLIILASLLKRHKKKNQTPELPPEKNVKA